MFSWILTAVAIPTATQPVRKIAYAVTLEDNNSNLFHFNAATVAATRRLRALSGLLAAIHDGIQHIPDDAQKLLIRVASPQAGSSQASAARLLVRRSSAGPKGARNQRQWAEIKGLLDGRTVAWKPVQLGSTDQLCAMERTCLHLLEEPLSFPKRAESALSPAPELSIAIQRPLSRRADVIAAPFVLRTVPACAERGVAHVA